MTKSLKNRKAYDDPNNGIIKVKKTTDRIKIILWVICFLPVAYFFLEFLLIDFNKDIIDIPALNNLLSKDKVDLILSKEKLIQLQYSFYGLIILCLLMFAIVVIDIVAMRKNKIRISQLNKRLKDKINYQNNFNTKFNLENIYSIEEWRQTKREEVFRNANREIVAVGFNLSHTFSEEFMLKTIKEKIILNDLKLKIYVSKADIVDEKINTKRLKTLYQNIQILKKQLSPDKVDNIKLLQLPGSNFDYIVRIDDSKIYIRWNLSFKDDLSTKTGIFCFEINGENSENDFVKPINKYLSKLEEIK